MSAFLAKLSASVSSSGETSNAADVPGTETLLPAARFPAVAALYGLNGAHGVRRRSRWQVVMTWPRVEGLTEDSDSGRSSALRIVVKGLWN